MTEKHDHPQNTDGSHPFTTSAALLLDAQLQDYASAHADAQAQVVAHAAASLRRVKPLPKRRRLSDDDAGQDLSPIMSDSTTIDGAVYPNGSSTIGLGTKGTTALKNLAAAMRPEFASYFHVSTTSRSFSLPRSASSPPSPEETSVTGTVNYPSGPLDLAHYRPHDGPAFTFDAFHASSTAGGVAFRLAEDGFGHGSVDDDDPDQLEGFLNYGDHLQQPGNAKKRKVPIASLSGLACAGFFQRNDLNEDSHGGTESSEEVPQGFSGGLLGGDLLHIDDIIQADPIFPLASKENSNASSSFGSHRFRASAATLSGLKRKEILKSRKRQIVSVLAGMPNADTMALEQALASSLPWYRSPTNGTMSTNYGLCFRHRDGALAESRPPRSATAVYSAPSSYSRTLHLQRHNDSTASHDKSPSTSKSPLTFVDFSDEPSFTFECHSFASERASTLRSEVATLTGRFQRELERQTAAAAEAARQAALATAAATGAASAAGGVREHLGKKGLTNAPTTQGKGGRRVRTKGVDGKNQSHSTPSVNTGESDVGTTLSSSAPLANNTNTTMGSRRADRKKKKKRSALANASNPHHLRNYVPSRLPGSGSSTTLAGASGSGYVGLGVGAPVITVTAAVASASFLGPAPLRFLTANYMRPSPGSSLSHHDNNNNTSMSASHTTTHTRGARGGTMFPAPADGMALIPDEWICAFCEYDVFYGGERAFRAALKARKKILRRRRIARERAARAASGLRPSSMSNLSGGGLGHEEEEEEEEEAAGEEVEEGSEGVTEDEIGDDEEDGENDGREGPRSHQLPTRARATTMVGSGGGGGGVG